MDKVVYSESFVREAQKLLRLMLSKNLEEIQFGKPFENMSVIIGNPNNRTVVVVVEVPEDLKKTITDKKVYVVI